MKGKIISFKNFKELNLNKLKVMGMQINNLKNAKSESNNFILSITGDCR